MSEPASGATELPVPDTADVRSGPEVAHELLSVLPLYAYAVTRSGAA